MAQEEGIIEVMFKWMLQLLGWIFQMLFNLVVWLIKALLKLVGYLTKWVIYNVFKKKTDTQSATPSTTNQEENEASE